MSDVKRAEKPYLAHFQCTECDFSADGTDPAEDAAKEHVRKTGHKVCGQLTNRVILTWAHK